MQKHFGSKRLRMLPTFNNLSAKINFAKIRLISPTDLYLHSMATININLKVIKKWESLKGYGDGTEIIKIGREQFGEVITKDILYKAFANRKCRENVFKAIAKYYQEKEKRIQKLTK